MQPGADGPCSYISIFIPIVPIQVILLRRKEIFKDMAANHPIHIHPARPLYRFTATALGASMWFFLMYRAKKDGPALLGWKHPWEH
ncbi:hypothetical protein F9C07_2140480 [Aspergillus flavus]|uniref:Uncharacterized protein n=12 Tax=Aspergillus subgen. Circumdati TaxID=2720871 RepID=A0A7U2QXP0_ASPFN|nr:hypothetical protein BDV35DRAFT_117481 [Aspergillus flavus]KAF7630029.1 hypothetical protein AFLA_010660 [Aspergillus flavus NRRL3357]QRD88691.1 hypothetical protein F9C07_2140480 [Aspergillus flavus]